MTGAAPLWPYIAGAYGVTVLALLTFGLQCWSRAGRARRRLAALESESPRRRGRAA